MPLGVIEALSYGLPCFVTEGTTLLQFVNENKCGWGVKTDRKEILKGLKKVYSDVNDFELMSNNAVRAINKCFTWEVIANDTLSKYEKIINSMV